jgi:CHASE3 domain sensor protein
MDIKEYLKEHLESYEKCQQQNSDEIKRHKQIIVDQQKYIDSLQETIDMMKQELSK